MFSMTDIKAHQVYMIVMFVPNLILVALSIFALPFASYMLGFSLLPSASKMLGFGSEDSLLGKIVLSINSYWVLGYVWISVVKAISFVLNELFDIIIDVSPSQGLSKDESKRVLFGGRAILNSFKYEANIRNVHNVRDERIERIARQGLFGVVFKDVARKRLLTIIDHYQKHPNETVSAVKIGKILEELGLKEHWLEKVINDAIEVVARQDQVVLGFKDVARKRLLAIIDHYQQNPNEKYSTYYVGEYLEELGLKEHWLEKVINNAIIGKKVFQNLFLLYLLFQQPSF